MKRKIFVISCILLLLSMNVFVFADTQYSNDLCTDTSKAMASGAYSDRAAARAFDNLNANYINDAWESADTTLPQWIGYDFGESGKKICKYTITGDLGCAEVDTPKTWIFQGSNNLSSWINLHNGNASSWTNGEKKEFVFDNDTAYRYYRIYITSIQRATPDYVVIGEVEMMGLLENAPGAPLNLNATAGNSNTVLSWNPVSGAINYNVKRTATSGGPYTTIASSVTATTYSDTTATNGNTYYYVVTAVNTTGESAPSNEVSATPVAPIANKIMIKTIDGFIYSGDLTAETSSEFKLRNIRIVNGLPSFSAGSDPVYNWEVSFLRDKVVWYYKN